MEGKSLGMGEKTELEILKEDIKEQKERYDNLIAQLMIMIEDLSVHNNRPTAADAIMAKLTKLEESVKKQEKVAATGVDMEKLCLFPNAKLPDRFKPIDWEKFDGSGDPKAHLQTYVGTLSMYGIEKDAMAQMFQ